MKSTAFAIAMAIASTLALAQTSGGNTAGKSAAETGTGTAGQRAGGTGQGSGPSVGSGEAQQLDVNATEYWTKTAREGYMTRDQVMGYRNPDGTAWVDKQGRPIDYSAMDADSDGRVSQMEWSNYHRGMKGDAKTKSGQEAPAPKR